MRFCTSRVEEPRIDQPWLEVQVPEHQAWNEQSCHEIERNETVLRNRAVSETTRAKPSDARAPRLETWSVAMLKIHSCLEASHHFCKHIHLPLHNTFDWMSVPVLVFEMFSWVLYIILSACFEGERHTINIRETKKLIFSKSTHSKHYVRILRLCLMYLCSSARNVSLSIVRFVILL